MPNNTTTADSDRSTESSGNLAEEIAARFLARNGLKIIVRNYRCRGGEIDLVCRDGSTIVFVEVRLRRSHAFGGAAASVTATKQRRIILASAHYLHSQRLDDADCRFDCILLDQLSADRIEWVRDAFAAD